MDIRFPPKVCFLSPKVRIFKIPGSPFRLSLHYLDDGLLSLYFLSPYLLHQFANTGALYGSKGPVRHDGDHAKLFTAETAGLGKETYDVHLVDLFLLATPYIESFPSGTRNACGGCYLHTVRNRYVFQSVKILIGSKDDVRRPHSIPTCRTTVAMNISLAVEGQMIMDDVVHRRQVKSPCCQIGAYHNVGASACKSEKRPFAVLLFHGAMKGCDTETFIA